MYYTHHYVIDWDKVQTLDDMKRLIQAVQITFEQNNPHLESIKHLVTEEEKPSNWFMSTTSTSESIEIED